MNSCCRSKVLLCTSFVITFCSSLDIGRILFDCPGKVIGERRNCSDKTGKRTIYPNSDGKLEVDWLYVSRANNS